MTIRSEIESKLLAYANAQTPKIPVALENGKFTKPTSGMWLEILFLTPVASNRQLSAAGKTVNGMFQVNCYAPTGEGMGRVEALVEAVINLYPVVPKMDLVSIERPLSPSNNFPVDAFICVPVTGQYRAEFY